MTFRCIDSIRKAASVAAFLIIVFIGAPVAMQATPVSVPHSFAAVVNNKKSKKNMPEKSTYQNPDFAFPETVATDARPMLDKALADKDGVEALRAAMQIIVARNLVSNSSFGTNVALVDTLANVLPQPYSGIASLLEATLYKSLYEGERWKYNQRTLPLDTYPEDPLTWSRDLFAKKVLELVDTSSSAYTAAKDMPVSALSSVLDNTVQAEKAGLSVYDFMVYCSSDLLETFDGAPDGGVIPFYGESKISATTHAGQCLERKDALITVLYDYSVSRNLLSPLTVAICAKGDIMDEDERIPFLKGWTEKLISTPEAARVLHAYCVAVRNGNQTDASAQKWLYDEMKDWIAKFPKAEGVAVIKYDLATLSESKAVLTLPSAALPGEPVKGKVMMQNMNKGYVLIYRMPEGSVPMNSLSRKDFPGKATFVKAIEVNVEGVIPFTSEKEIEISPLSAGYYVALPSATPRLSSKWRGNVEIWQLKILSVSDIAIISSTNRTEKESGRLYVADARTQRPIEGAEIGLYDSDNSQKLIKKGYTDKDGSYVLPEGNYRVRASYKGNVAWRWADFHFYKQDQKPETMGSILTDLSIYKPGGELGFSVVCWTRNRHDNTLLKNVDVNVVMRDANYNPVDTLRLKTDSYGRCAGSFQIPKTGLLGNYTLLLSLASQPNTVVARRGVQVAEYKTPGFLVTVESEAGNTPKAGELLKFKGDVKTYSGMPLGGSAVTYDIRWEPWWLWWRSGGNGASYSGTAETDADGKFLIELPTDKLKGTRFEHGIFTLTVSATSSSGETQSASPLRFTIGEGFTVSPSIPSMMKIDGDTVSFNVPVYDMLDHPVVKDVEYTMKDMETGKTVSEGTFRSPRLSLPASLLPSARYEFSFNLPGDTLKNNTTVAVYRDGDMRPPYKAILWVPETRIVSRPGEGNVNVKVGSGYEGSWLLCEVSDENGFVRRGWYEANGCNIEVPVKAPAPDSRLWVTFSGMHDLMQESSTVVIIPEGQLRKLEVKASSFRNRISAGDKEVWKFNFSIDGETQAGLPAMAVMSNKALNAIAPFEWNFSIGRGYWGTSSNLSYYSPGQTSTTGRFSVTPRYYSLPNVLPEWNTYGYGLANDNFGRYRMLSRSIRGGGDMVMYDSVAEEVMSTVQVTSLKMDMKAPDNGVKMKMAKSEADDEAEYEMEAPVAEPAEAGGAAPKEMEKPRPIEMPLAFFMPNLVSGDDGNVEVAFETPNFNTTWQFQIAGYTEDLLTAGLMLDAVASKPVMVQTNVPRYLRTGDDAEISALLFNNADTDLMLHGEIRVFNPETGETLTSFHIGAENTAPSAHRVVSVSFKVPDNVSSVGVTAYALSNNFSDGEEAIIPVLPSSTPVVESTVFYLGRGEGAFNQKVPKLPKGANVTLKYCSNPVWECVLALPSISTPESKNILSLMRALYANSLALDVVTKYPEVKKGLEKALAEKDSLKSNLEKDASLKTVGLENTPWVNNASSETERMRSLSSLLDPDKGRAAVSAIINDLKGLQNADGGWSWCPGMKSSLFMTGQALLQFGMMREIGCMPKEAEEMVRKALTYADKEVYKDYLDSKKKYSTTYMLNYLYLRALNKGGNGPSGFAELKRKALKSISEEWRGFSVYEKATAATLLSRSEGYEREARIILESLNQLASKSDAKGWWFDNLASGFGGWNKLITTAQALEAYAAIEPESPAVDGLRQWLILQKETEDWGSNSYTVEVIQAILSSGSDWTVATSSPEVTLGGKRVEVPETGSLPGVVTISLPVSQASGKQLTVKKDAEVPVWGGIISQYVSPIKDVKSASCENLKVEKKVMLVTSGETGETLTEPSSFKVGDKVRVTLTLTCGKDMDYVALIDERAACTEPEDQLSRYEAKDGIWMYREVRDSKTSFFIGFLPKGVNVISYDCHIDREGTYAIGIASAQSQYSPIESAHSSGGQIIVK